ncbi:hypothetical protein RSOLAG22IIIB_12831 [Rhizoctonia solani]|uniref:Uncharacterized protein n=1 Tax=Rhizoctonia solani TaxID=456999 RepID=A0A0K6GGQ3_9AGAM|nr:hypothetical protein RSOLAG22IIIB_12831 [Rhizoctonia solani]
MVASGSLRAWSPRPGGAFSARKRYAMQLMTQANSITRKPKPKRKRTIIYSSSDTEDEPVTPKRVCTAAAECKLSYESPLGLDVWEEHTDGPFFGLSHEEEEVTVEYARSSPEMDLSDLSDVSPTSPDDDLFDALSASSGDDGVEDYQLYDDSAIKRFAQELPSLLQRRYRTLVLSKRTHWIDDEPLRIKFLNRQFKHRLQTGDFTVSQIMEVLEQRPVYGTYGDLNIPTPQVVPAQADADEPEDLDLGLMAAERPSTPMPDSDSDSDSDSEPVYDSTRVVEQLSRREMESMGIYEDEEYEYESEDE